MSAEAACAASRAPDHCITCGDEGIELRVLAVETDGARCAAADGRVHDGVLVDLVEPLAPGDRILVHAGVALRRLEAAA